jgi:hypothetical protein
MASRRDRCGGAALDVLLVWLAFAGLARADAGAAEALVRTHWFEGVPYEQARALDLEGVRRVIELLEDPAEAEYHSNAVMALGMSGSPEAFAALARFAAREPRGEVALSVYRARNALPFALGHLARSDRRALALLERQLAQRGDPGWSYRHLSGERLRSVLERSAISALGLSGVPEAEPLLEGAARRNPKLAERVERARALRERVAREGAARVFGGRE